MGRGHQPQHELAPRQDNSGAHDQGSIGQICAADQKGNEQQLRHNTTDGVNAHDVPFVLNVHVQFIFHQHEDATARQHDGETNEQTHNHQAPHFWF